jgi:hypothetical protein
LAADYQYVFGLTKEADHPADACVPAVWTGKWIGG